MTLARKASVLLRASVSLTYERDERDGCEASVTTNARNCSSCLRQAVRFQSLWKRHRQRTINNELSLITGCRGADRPPEADRLEPKMRTPKLQGRVGAIGKGG